MPDEPNSAFTVDECTGVKNVGTEIGSPTAISDASGGATVDAEARTALNAALQVLRDIGIIT